MWFFKDKHATPNDALRQNRRAALLIGVGVLLIASAAFLNFPARRILLATPTMPDKIFAQSTVLVMRHGLAKQGVILNRPLTPEQTAQLPAAMQGQISAYGGPVNFPDGVAILAWRPTQPDDATLTLLDNVALSDAAALQTNIAQLQTQGYRVRLFAGHAGWTPLQLEMEMWLVSMWQRNEPTLTTEQRHSLFDGSGANWATLRQHR